MLVESLGDSIEENDRIELSKRIDKAVVLFHAADDLAKRLSVSFDSAGGSGGGAVGGQRVIHLNRRGSSFDSHDDSFSEFDQYLYESESESESEIAPEDEKLSDSASQQPVLVGLDNCLG
jgi:hypothetical protein